MRRFAKIALCLAEIAVIAIALSWLIIGRISLGGFDAGPKLFEIIVSAVWIMSALVLAPSPIFFWYWKRSKLVLSATMLALQVGLAIVSLNLALAYIGGFPTDDY